LRKGNFHLYLALLYKRQIHFIANSAAMFSVEEKLVRQIYLLFISSGIAPFLFYVFSLNSYLCCW